MIEIKRILHPTDFSASSAAAAGYAGFLAQQFGAELHLLYVIEDALGKIPNLEVGFPAPDESDEQTLNEPTEVMRTALGVQWQSELRVVLATKLGPPEDEILGYARQHDIGLIVMGTHGRKGVSHMLMGSVAESVSRQAPCPVMTVRPQIDQPRQ